MRGEERRGRGVEWTGCVRECVQSRVKGSEGNLVVGSWMDGYTCGKTAVQKNRTELVYCK